MRQKRSQLALIDEMAMYSKHVEINLVVKLFENKNKI
jgi:hypothetical protein